MKRSILYGIIGIGIIATISFALASSLGLNQQSDGAPTNPTRQILAGSNIILSADTLVDEGEKPISYRWIQLSGQPVLLSDSNSSQPSFSISPAEDDRKLTFQVEVSDGEVTKPSVVEVVVVANKPPVADAGKDMSVSKSQQVILDGSKSSDPENVPLLYNWVQIDGPTVQLSDISSAKPSFVSTASSGTTLTFQLLVNDGMLVSEPDTITVKINPNAAPTANAGHDQNATNGDIVTLSGIASSDPENDKLAYRWNQTSGPAVELSDPNAIDTTFIAPSLKNGKAITFQLIVNDGVSDSKPDTVKIIVGANKPPVADAGPDITVGSSSKVALNATRSSDPENGSLSYRWNQTSGPAVELSDPNAPMPSFQPPTVDNGPPKVLVFRLIVSDGTHTSKPDWVKVTIRNDMPVANAGANQTVQGQTQVILDGSKSTDPMGKKLTYEWTQLSGPSVVLSDLNDSKPTFKAPARGDKDKVMIFQLVVGNNSTKSEPNIVNVTVLGNKAPIANAGPDKSYEERRDIVLDGSKSTDPNGDKLTYQWKQISGPSVTLKFAKLDQAVFKAPAVSAKRVLEFQLTVSDGTFTTSDTLKITIWPD